MAEDNKQPVTSSIEEQRRQTAQSLGTVASGEEWLRVMVRTGKSTPSGPRIERDQMGEWIAPPQYEAGQEPWSEYVEDADGRVKKVDHPGVLKQNYETVSAQELVSQWFTMDGLERNRYKDTFILLGLVDPRSADDARYSQVWTSYVQQLARYNMSTPGGAAITIGDLIMGDLKTKESQDPGLSELLRTGKRTTTRTSTNIQKSSNLDARALADASARALLGRKANDEESARLLAALNKMEEENPETTVTSTQEDMYGQVLGQSSTTSGGVSATSREQLAREAAEANPEYGAYQAATTYMGSLMDMVYGRGY